ncbi:MAG: YHS domain-containing (seleno)protein [Parvularculaceae bacterium]
MRHEYLQTIGFFLRPLIAAFAAALVAIAPALARAPEIYMNDGGLFGAPWEYAVNGYDVVAYFDLAEGAPPVEGADLFVTEYKGVKWRFANAENLAAFKANPDRYRPQYGGYCAWAIANDSLAKGDPKVWYVYEGKLYLNVNRRIQRDWLSDIPDFIARAESNWPGILDRN